jgi:uncharacterized membrane protein YhaH (DUF805 family)
MPASDPSTVQCSSCGFVVPVAERCESCNSPLAAAPAQAIRQSPVREGGQASAPASGSGWQPPPVIGRAPPPPQSEYLTKLGFGSFDTGKLRDGILECLKETRNVSGRTSREVFGAYVLGVIALLAAITFIAVTFQPVLYTTKFVNVSGFIMPMSTFDSDAFAALLTMAAIPLIIALGPLTTAAIRRLHDTGKSGRLVGVALVFDGIAVVDAINGNGMVGLVLFLGTSAVAAYALSRPGDPAPNQYGPAPSI